MNESDAYYLATKSDIFLSDYRFGRTMLALDKLCNDSEDEEDNIFDYIASLAAEGEIPGFAMESFDDEGDNEAPRRRRRPNKSLIFAHSQERFERMCFSAESVHDEQDFRRGFRMPRHLFE